MNTVLAISLSRVNQLIPFHVFQFSGMKFWSTVASFLKSVGFSLTNGYKAIWISVGLLCSAVFKTILKSVGMSHLQTGFHRQSLHKYLVWFAPCSLDTIDCVLYKLNLIFSLACICLKSDESPQRYLHECPLYDNTSLRNCDNWTSLAQFIFLAGRKPWYITL